MVLNSQRTVYGNALNLAMLAGVPYKVLDNTSLNEKFKILTSEGVPNNVYPTINYFAIGVGGSDIISNNGYSYSKHSPVDAGLFKQIPFIIRATDDDLIPNERAKYRFRVIEHINGIEYVCYYLKKIENINLVDEFYKVTTDNGVSKLSIYDTNVDTLLNPIAIDRSQSAVDPTKADYLLKIMKLDFVLTSNELLELENVFNILQLSETAVSEIGVCTGVDRIFNGVQEATCTQVYVHVGMDIELTAYLGTTQGFLRSIELGGGEPMYL